jgi:hypothetical protein
MPEKRCDMLRHDAGSSCENKGQNAEFYSDREKMQGKLPDFCCLSG